MHLSRTAKWTAVSAGTAALAGVLARKSLEQGWRRVAGREPPRNPASSDTPWREALVWGGLTGLGVGVARVAARRGAASGWRRIVGRRAPTR